MKRSLLAALTAFAVVAPAAGSAEQGQVILRSATLTRSAAGRIGTTMPARRSARAAATWCGTATDSDQAPNVVAGNAAHWIYAAPSDGEERLASVATVMQTDAETIADWWRAQDPAREPRNDFAQLSCGAQLDVTALRLPHSSEQLSPPDSRFSEIVGDISAAGFASRFDKYLVYYDGPAPSDICGEGGGFAAGVGFAIVYVQACPGVASSVVAIHELVHTYGAVPLGAPHMCPAPNGFHVCDDPHDLMYPFADGTPLSGLSLDFGKDDYYGHSGAWPDIQDSPWLVQRDRQTPFTLSISGPGTVASDVPGLQCTESCTTTWNADTNLVLTATPGDGARFVRWSGACNGSFSCSVRTSTDATATALFAPARYRLSVAVSGKGLVRSSTGSVRCARRCSASVSSYTPIRLTARASTGWKLKSWGGACHGVRGCTVPMSGNTAVRATFVRR